MENMKQTHQIKSEKDNGTIFIFKKINSNYKNNK